MCYIEEVRRSSSTLILVYTAYVFLIALLRWQWNFDLLLFALGGLFGLGFVYVDRLIQVFLVRPHEHLSEHVRHLVKEKRVVDAMRLLRDRGHEQQNLTVRSVFFMGAWVPVALFVMTSTGNMLATGLVMGIGLHLLYEVWMDWADLERLRKWLFWPIRRYVRDSEIKGVVVMYTVFFTGLSLSLI